MDPAFGAEGEEGEGSIDAMDIDGDSAVASFEEESLRSSDEESGEHIRQLLISLDTSRVIDLHRLMRKNAAVYAMSVNRVGYVYLANTIQELANALGALFGQGKYNSDRMSGWNISLVTSKRDIDALTFFNEVKPLSGYISQHFHFDDRLKNTGYQTSKRIALVERKKFASLFDVQKTWFLDQRLLTEFLHDSPDEENSLHNIDVRRVQTSYHSAGSWRFVESSVSVTMGERFQAMQLLNNSRNRFFTHIEAFRNRSDRVNLYFNDQLHMDYGQQGLGSTAKPFVRVIDQEGFKTRPSGRSIEVWMHILHALRNQDTLTNKERAAAIDYLITMLVISQSLLSDPQGRSFFLLMARPHISRNERIQLKLLLQEAQDKDPLTQIAFVSSNSADANGKVLSTLIDDETMDLLCGIAGFVDVEAPLLGDIKQSSAHAHLFPLVIFETARANSQESFGLAASVMYPYRAGGTVTNSGESSQANLDLELDYSRLLHYLSHHEAPQSGRIRILPSKYLGREQTFELFDVRRIFPEYHIETVTGNTAQLTTVLAIDQIIFFAWRTLYQTYPDLDLTTFIREGFCDRYIAGFSKSIDDPQEDEFWAPLVLRAYNDFTGTPKTFRLKLLYNVTRAIADYYGAGRSRAFRLSKSMRNMFALALDTETSKFEATQERHDMLLYLRSYWLAMTSRDLTSLYYERYLVDLQPYWLNIDAAVEIVKQYSVSEKLYPNILDKPDYSKLGRWFDGSQGEIGAHINEWARSKEFEFPFLYWTCQFSLALPREVFQLDARITKLVPLFKTSAQTWLPMGVRGLTKPKWHLLIPTELLLSIGSDADKEKKIPVVVTQLPVAKNLVEGNEFQTFYLQHFFMLFPHNYYLLFLISNGIFDKAYSYIVRSNAIISGDNAEKNAFFKHAFLFRTDILVRDRGVVPVQIEDIVMANFVIGLGIRNAIEPGYLDTIDKRLGTEDIFKVFFKFDGADDKVFRFLPGAVTFTEAARIGHPKLLDLLFYGPNFLKTKDAINNQLTDYVTKRSTSLKQSLRLTALPISYYTLPPPYRLMTPWNLLQTHQLVAQVHSTSSGQSQPKFDTNLINVLQDLDTGMMQRFPLIDIGVRFTQHVQNLVAERAEREAQQLGAYSFTQRRLRQTTAASLVRSMQAEAQHNHPMYYGPDDVIDLDTSKDHIYKDATHYLPLPNQFDDDDEMPVLGEPDNADKTDETNIARINTLLINMSAQMRGGVDVDLMLASHKRMWQNLHIAALKKAVLTPTPIQLTLPFGVGQPGEEEGEEGGFLPSVASPSNDTQPYIPAYADLLPFDEIEKLIEASNQSEKQRKAKLPFGAGNSDEISGGDDDDEAESMVEHDDNIDLGEYEENKRVIAERNKAEDLSSSNDMSLSGEGDDDEEEEEKEKDEASESVSDDYTQPKRRQLEYLQTLEDIKTDKESKWYHDIVHDEGSTANLISSATSNLLNTEIRRAMRSLVSTLAIPVTLGLIAHRVRDFVALIVNLKKGYTTLSHLTEAKEKQLRTDLATKFNSPLKLQINSIWRPLLTGLEMLSLDNTMLPIILSGLCDSLKASILMTAKLTEENSALLLQIDVNKWIAKSIKLHKLKNLAATAHLENVEEMNENELAFRLRPLSLVSKSSVPITIDSDIESTEAQEADRYRDQIQRSARATLESVTFLQSHIALHRTTESSLEPGILTFAQDFAAEFEIAKITNRQQHHPLFSDINTQDFTTESLDAVKARTMVEAICEAPLYTVEAEFVRATLNHYLMRHVDRLVLDVLFQSMDTTLGAWMRTMRAFVVSAPKEDTNFNVAAHSEVFDTLFDTSPGAKRKSARYIAMLRNDDTVQYDPLTEALMILLFGSATERRLSKTDKRENMTSLEKLAASCLVNNR